MPLNVLDTLITGPDTWQIVRDRTALILQTESDNQVALATNAGEPDPSLWKLRVYIQRAKPWEMFLPDEFGVVSDLSPVINVWHDTQTFPENMGDVVQSQQSDITINMDAYGFAVTMDDGGTGQLPGDEYSARAAEHGAELCRKILMASSNVHLQLQGFVGKRWPGNITEFQPELDAESAEYITAVRFPMGVHAVEYSPQYTPEILEKVHVDLKRSGDGQVIADAEFDYT